MIVTDKDLRTELAMILGDIRNGMLANKAKAPVFPCLQAAEERLLRLMYEAQQVDDYLQSSAAGIYIPDE